MTSVSTDRRLGINASKAVKVPCIVAATANIALSGEQTVSGITVTSGDRVLVTAQTNAQNNGVYDVSTGSWTRSLDFDSVYDVAPGTMVPVWDGTTYTQWVLANAEIVGIGVTELVFSQALSLSTLASLEARLADATDITHGDALVAYKAPLANAVARTVHQRLAGLALDPMDMGAVGTGLVNDATAINNAIQSAGAGGHIYLGPGTYLCNSPIALNKANMLFEMAPGATLKLGNTINDNVIYVTANGVRVTGGKINGNRANQTRESTANAGIALSGCNAVQVDNVEIFDCAGSGINVFSVSELKLLFNYIHETDLGSITGASGVSAVDWLIEGNQCIRANDTTQNDASCIGVIGAAGTPISHVRVVNNFCRMPTAAISATIAVGITVRCQYATVSGNSIYGGYMGVSLDGFQSTSTYIACTSNTMFQPKNYGIEIGGVGYCSIADNVVHGNAVTATGAIIDTGLASNFNVIRGNVFTGIASECIKHTPSGSNSASVTIIAGNMIEGCPLGIRMQQSANWIISNNFYSGNNSSPFVLAQSNASGTIAYLTCTANQVSNATAVVQHTAASAVALNRCIIKHNTLSGATAHLVNSAPALLGTNVSVDRNSAGNVAAPTMPTSGVATQNPQLTDAMVYLTAASSVACTVAIDGTTLYTLAAAQTSPFNLKAGQAVTLTYGTTGSTANAPSWKWQLD